MTVAARAVQVFTRMLPAKAARSKLTQPVASFTFDDFPKSAWTVGGPILAEFRAQATYYAAGSRCGTHADNSAQYDRNDLREVAAAGHEVGCHSWGHRASRDVTSRELRDDVKRNEDFFGEVLGDCRPVSFAYPFGDVVPRTKMLYAKLFATSRGIRGGLNSGLLDLAQLRVVSLPDVERDPGLLDRMLDRAHAENAWIVFLTHDVADAHEQFGCTPATLRNALAKTRDRGIDVLPVKHALARAVF